MRTMTMVAMWMVTMQAGCELASDATAVQAVAGPSVTVTVRDVGQLSVSWTADSAATSYQVYQSAGGGAFSLVATVFDSGGGAPATSWIADELSAGAYCYAIRAVYPTGQSDPSVAKCASASGASTPPRMRPISGLTVVSEWQGQAGGPGATRTASTWTFANQNWMYFPVPVSVGETIAGYQVYVFKGSSSAFTVISSLIEVDSASGQQTALGGASNNAAAPGRLLLGTQSLTPRIVAPGVTYLIRIADGSGSAASAADSFTDATLFIN